MKRVYLILPFLIFAFLSPFISQAQTGAPLSFNYQAVARNATTGDLLPPGNATVVITLTDNVTTVTESHDVSINKYGLFSLNIGSKTAANIFNSLNWAGGNVFVSVSVNGTSIGSNKQLLSVPYAIYSNSSGSSSASSDNLVLTGKVLPVSTLGKVGDVYIDNITKILYGPKTTVGWPTVGTPLGGSSTTGTKKSFQAGKGILIDTSVGNTVKISNTSAFDTNNIVKIKTLPKKGEIIYYDGVSWNVIPYTPTSNQVLTSDKVTGLPVWAGLDPDIIRIAKTTAIDGNVIKYDALSNSWKALPDATGTVGGGVSKINELDFSDHTFKIDTNATLGFKSNSIAGTAEHLIGIPTIGKAGVNKGVLSLADYTAFKQGLLSGSTPYTSGSGINISTTNIITARKDSALWNANRIFGFGIGGTPGNGKVLRMQGGVLTFLTDSTGGSGTSYVKGTGILNLSGNHINVDSSKAIWNANQLQTRPVAVTVPIAGQVLKFKGGQWIPSPDSVATITGIPYTAGRGMTLNGTAFEADSNVAIWNASQLQTRPVASTVPIAGQVLKFKGGQWIPSPDSVANFWTKGGTNILYSTNTLDLVGIGTTTPLSKLHVAGFLRSDSLKGTDSSFVGVGPNGMLIRKKLPTTSTGSAWALTGNPIIPGNFLGSTNNNDLVLKANGYEGLRVDSATGNIGLGVNTPTEKLTIDGNIRFNSGNRSILVSPPPDNYPGGALFIKAGDATTGTLAFLGGDLTLEAGHKYTTTGPAGGANLILRSGGNITSGLSNGGDIIMQIGGANKTFIDKLSIFQNGKILFGSNATGYFFPTVKGNPSDHLVLDATNNLTWAPATGALSTNWSVNGNDSLSLTIDTTVSFLGSKSNYPLVFKTRNIQRMRITRSGNIFVQNDLNVGGRIRSSNITETSDRRYKKDISPLTNSLDKVKKLQGVSYKWRKDEFPEMKLDDGTDIGLIAQEVEKILPELVNTDEKGFKSIEYSHLVALLIEGMKEQQKQIETLRSEIATKDGKVQNSESRIESLESSIKTLSSQMQMMMELVGSKEGLKAGK